MYLSNSNTTCRSYAEVQFRQRVLNTPSFLRIDNLLLEQIHSQTSRHMSSITMAKHALASKLIYQKALRVLLAENRICLTVTWFHILNGNT